MRVRSLTKKTIKYATIEVTESEIDTIIHGLQALKNRPGQICGVQENSQLSLYFHLVKPLE